MSTASLWTVVSAEKIRTPTIWGYAYIQFVLSRIYSTPQDPEPAQSTSNQRGVFPSTASKSGESIWSLYKRQHPSHGGERCIFKRSGQRIRSDFALRIFLGGVGERATALTWSWSGDTVTTERTFPRHKLIGDATPSDDGSATWTTTEPSVALQVAHVRAVFFFSNATKLCCW